MHVPFIKMPSRNRVRAKDSHPAYGKARKYRQRTKTSVQTGGNKHRTTRGATHTFSASLTTRTKMETFSPTRTTSEVVRFSTGGSGSSMGSNQQSQSVGKKKTECNVCYHMHMCSPGKRVE